MVISFMPFIYLSSYLFLLLFEIIIIIMIMIIIWGA